MIVFCHLLNDTSGSPVVLKQAIRALRDVGEDGILFVGSQGRGLLETAGLPIRRYWYRRSRFRIVTLFTFFASQLFLYRALSRASLPHGALIYANTLLPVGAMLWGRRHGHPVLCHVHEVSISPRPLRSFLLFVAARTCDQTIHVSRDNLDRLPVPGVASTIIPNPVAPDLAAQGAVTPYLPRRSGRFDVLMLASPRDFKGVPEFLALARAFADREDIGFTLVLNADQAEADRYVPHGQRPANLTVHPRTDRPGDFYANADVILNLSRPDEWIETFGLTLVEGMAFGLPVIAPPIGGPVEIVEGAPEQVGYTCDGRDTDRLAALLDRLIADPKEAHRLSEAARRRAASYSQQHFARQLATLTKTLGQGKAGP